MQFLNFGVNQNYRKKKKSIFKESFIIKKKETIFELRKKEILKKNLKFNSFYYYCISKFKRNKKDKELIKLFNFAITFYKHKLDIIYFFHVTLLIEKILESKRDTFINDEDDNYFNLDDN